MKNGGSLGGNPLSPTLSRVERIAPRCDVRRRTGLGTTSRSRPTFALLSFGAGCPRPERERSPLAAGGVGDVRGDLRAASSVRRGALGRAAPNLALYALLLACLTVDLRAQVTGIHRELFTGLERVHTSLWPLTNDVRFLQNNPSSTSILASFRSEPTRGDDYGQRLRAFITAPTSGNYTFAIASDEVSDLFLSSDEFPANK